MGKLAHAMVRVVDEARSLDFYRRALGLEVADRLEFDDFVLVYLSNRESSFELELTVNKDRADPYDLGDGYGHLAVTVDDIEAEHRRLTADNFAPRKLVDFQHHGQTLARFFFIADPDGYQIEVIQKQGRFR